MLRVIENFRARLAEAIPKRPDGTPIKAWNEFAVFAQELHERVAWLEANGPGPEPEPEPEPEPQPTPKPRLAPRTYNLASNNADPRFCVQSPGVTRRSDGVYVDEGGYEYNGDGMNTGGKWRDRTHIVAGLKPANEMDGRSACDPYGSFPPWPAGSYEP
jgi:hypothetical protein